MIPLYDTIALQDEISKILDKYRPEDTPLPDIESDNYLKIMQEYRQKISSDCRIKMNILMVTLGYTDRTSSKLHELIKSMIDECDENLKEEEKQYLKWKNEDNCKSNTNSYSFLPKPDTIDKWLSGKRSPNRLSLYKIAFALNLPIYLFDFAKKMDMQSKEYISSANYLFNKVYNQRYSSKEADELIFVYNLVNGVYDNRKISYLEAMKMLASYNKKSMLNNNTDLICDNKSTILIIGKGIGMKPEPFVNFLSQLSPTLNIRHSDVIKKIESIIKKFADGNRTSKFIEKYYDINNTFIRGSFDSGDIVSNSDNNMADYVLISSMLKHNIEFLERRLTLCSVIHSNNYNSRRISRIKEIFQKCDISDRVFEYLSNFEIPDTADIMLFITKEIMMTEKEVYIIFSEDDKKVSQAYEKMRNILIVTHFLDYWSGLDYEPDYEDYKLSIDNMLMKFGYMPMYTQNLFDSFFMICSQLKDPIASYYNIIDEIVIYYGGFQNSFLSVVDNYNYNHLSAKIPIIEYMEVADCVDDKDVQNKLFKPIR